jgi:ribonuclease HI
MAHSDRLIFYIDGASHGNPGPSGIGVVVCDKDNNVIGNISEYIGEGTNNIAEYNALVYSLQEAIIRKASSVFINTDSELLVKQLNGEYKVKDEKLRYLFNQIIRLLKCFKEVQLNHIERSKNKGADKLATKAIDNILKKQPQHKQATFTFDSATP